MKLVTKSTMSSSTLSAVIEKLIRSLCLNDFPCGNGTWVSILNTDLSIKNTKGSAERAEMESTDALLDLLSCPRSPWRHDVMWSPQALPLRQLAVQTPERLHAPFIYNYFTSLRIVDRDVTAIDGGLLKFSKLEELVLSANKISEVPTANLPGTLKGNPFTLASSYPGLTVDSLPQLSCLDTSWISPEERHRFRGLAKMSGECVSPVSEGPNPRMTVDDKAPNFPVVSYRYFISYVFLRHQTPAHSVTYPSHTFEFFSISISLDVFKCFGWTFLYVFPISSSAVLRHTTSKLSWSESMDFGDTQTHTVSALGDLKKFLNRGLRLSLEEEKVQKVRFDRVCDYTGLQPNFSDSLKSPVKSDFTKSKDKNKKSVPELVQDAPIRRILGSVHIPLQSLVRGGQQVKVLCDFGVLHTDSEVEATQTHQKANSITSQPVIVELIVELKKWQTASEAHHFLLPQTS
uniref:Leucine rich repeat containing 43 n=1 Tax=Oreochromis niloticus TaxID=8128 RepID=I3K6D1_ORENI